MDHNLKSWPTHFEHWLVGAKTFEIRRNDRNFALGDHLTLFEYRPEANKYTGRAVTLRITHLMSGDNAGGIEGLKPGYVIMSCAVVGMVIANAKPPVEDPKPSPTPSFRAAPISAVVTEVNPVMQIVRDERGEFHQLTGAQRDESANVDAEVWLYLEGDAKGITAKVR